MPRSANPVPRLPRSARQGHRPRRIRPQSAPARHAARKDLPQHGRARPHHAASTSRAAQRDARRAPRRHRSRTSASVIPDPYYGPAFHDQPILALDKVRHVGEPVAVVLAADPHVAEQAAQLIEAEYEELPAVYRRGRGDDVDGRSCTTCSSPPARFPTSSICRAGATPTSRSISICGAATPTRRFAAADHVFEHTFRTQQVLHLPLEPFVSLGRADRRPAHHPHRLADRRRSCASRSRGCSAGRRTACA